MDVLAFVPARISHEPTLESRQFILKKKRNQIKRVRVFLLLKFLISVVVVVVQVYSLMRPVNVSIRTF